MHKELEEAIEFALHQIVNYKDEVWDSSDGGVTKEESERALALLIYNHLFCQMGVYHVDGADVGLAIETIIHLDNQKKHQEFN